MNKGDKLINACKEGNLKDVEYYCDDFVNTDAFFTACKFGHTKVVTWLVSRFPVLQQEFGSAVNCACREGQLDMIKYFNMFGLVEIKDDYFISNCADGNLDVAKWMYSIKGKQITSSVRREAFGCCCTYGQLDVAKWLYGLTDVKVFYNMDDMFRHSCISGQQEMADWLLDLTYGVVLYNMQAIVNDTYKKNHIDVVRWLCKTFPERISHHHPVLRKLDLIS